MKTKQIHLVMPHMRHWMRETLVKYYEPMNIILHPIMYQEQSVEGIPWDKKWVEPAIVPDGSGKINNFIFQHNFIDDDYYVYAADDSMFEPNVFDAVKQFDDDVVVISLKRGHHVPEGLPEIRRYPTNTLIACPENMRIGEVSGDQIFVKGRHYKTYLWDLSHRAPDGLMAEHFFKNYKIRYEPGLFSLFNYFEPGRWDHQPDLKISFGAMINDAYRFNTVLKKSDLPGELTYVVNPESATKGLNQILGKLESEGADVAILTHQDMHFRNGWLEKVKLQIAKLPESWAVAGIIGKDMQGRMCGKLHDMRIVDHINSSAIHTFPEPACCFDECVIIVNMKHSFRFDEDLDGFDLYGTLCVLQAWEKGLTAWIIDAWAEHYCMRPFSWFPGDDFKARYKKLYDKYLAMTETIDSTVFVSRPRFETSAAPMSEAA